MIGAGEDGRKQGKVGFCSIVVFLSLHLKKTTSLEFWAIYRELVCFDVHRTVPMYYAKMMSMATKGYMQSKHRCAFLLKRNRMPLYL